MTNLTPKQENFVQVYVECGNASEAYRRVYNAGSMKPQTVNKRASELLLNGVITGRIEALRAALRKKFEINIEPITQIYLEDRQIAHELGNPSAAVSATTGLARLYGLDKQVHHVKRDPDSGIAR